VSPSKGQAIEFASMIRAGVPLADVASCFVPAEVEGDHARATLAGTIADRWPKHPLVSEALAAQDGGVWHKLEDDTKYSVALKKHYAEMAHFIMTHNFAEAHTQNLAKLNDCRDVLEKKIAGTAGKSDPFTQYLQAAVDRFAKSKQAATDAEAVH
jgi:hypothetical protein